MGCHFLLQGIFPTQGLNLGLLHCRQIPYAEIMAMNPQQNAQENSSAASENPVQTAQNPAPDSTPAPAQTPPAPATPAPAETPAQPAPAQSEAGDAQTVILDKLDNLIAAIQAGNRSGASVQTPEKKTPEEIAGQLY